MKYKVVEKFVSINGEGYLSGQLAIFIRFKGCNLDCSYCDTRWANEENATYELMTKEDIYNYIKSTEVKNVTLTGGEPLIQEGMMELLSFLCKDESISIEIETNGSVDIERFTKIQNNRPKFTMDYKLLFSNMEDKMRVNNFKYLTKNDTVKFVVSSKDLERTKYIIDKYNLINTTNVYISPVFDEVDMNDIVEFMKNNKMNGATLQIQLHKIIWDPNKKGV